jgi:hypothetical protein
MSSALGTVVSLAARVGGSVVRGVRSVVDPSATRPAGGGAPASGWLVVTVLREPSDIDPARLPAPLAAFGDGIEARVRPAADGKGAELAVRPARRPSGNGSGAARLTGGDPRGDLRSALREAKQLIEVGEVLAVDPTPHGKRKATPVGAALEAVTKRAREGGVL